MKWEWEQCTEATWEKMTGGTDTPFKAAADPGAQHAWLVGLHLLSSRHDRHAA